MNADNPVGLAEYVRALSNMPTRTLSINSVWNLLRFYRPWRLSFTSNVSLIDSKMPWMTFAAIEFLEGFLDESKLVYEYGCGGSSLFFAQRAKRVISVEHNPVWAQKVNEDIQKAGLTNWQYHLVTPSIKDSNCDPSYRSSATSLEDVCFERYAKTIDVYPDHSFDVVVVDGRARVGCALHAVRKVAPGGCFVLDNSERSWYEPVHRWVDRLGWKKHDFFGPGPCNKYFWGTTIWQNNG